MPSSAKNQQLDDSEETIKLKQNPPETETNEPNQIPSDTEYSSDDEDYYKHMTPLQIKQYRLYKKKLAETDNFDVDFVPEAFPRHRGGFILPRDLNDPKEYDFIKERTDYVIATYNSFMKKRDSELEFVELLKALASNSINPTLYITFVAEDTRANRTDTYETRIVHHIITRSPIMEFIRIKGQEEDISFFLDLDDPEEKLLAKKFAEIAISEYNEELEKERKPKVEYVNVVKARQDMDMWITTYSIAFEAKNSKSGNIDTYFTETLIEQATGEIEVHYEVTPEAEMNEDDLPVNWRK